jgi:hypothetical protein
MKTREKFQVTRYVCNSASDDSDDNEKVTKCPII